MAPTMLVLMPGIDVDHARDLAHALGELIAQSIELGVVWAEQLDLDWPRTAGEVIEHVLQDLDELDSHFWVLATETCPNVSNDVLVAAAAAWFEAHHDVAPVELRGRGRTELRAEPTRERLHLRRRAELPLDAAGESVGGLEGSPRRQEVIDDECALIHRR
jgi:hypothetical protein